MRGARQFVKALDPDSMVLPADLLSGQQCPDYCAWLAKYAGRTKWRKPCILLLCDGSRIEELKITVPLSVPIETDPAPSISQASISLLAMCQQYVCSKVG